MLKTAENVKIIETNFSRNDFTLQGLPLNIPGKEKLAELIEENIKNLTARKEETPIIPKWGENQKDPTPKEAKEKLIDDDIKEPNLKKSDHQRDKNEIWLRGTGISFISSPLNM
jgi:hypothetical protein